MAMLAPGLLENALANRTRLIRFVVPAAKLNMELVPAPLMVSWFVPGPVTVAPRVSAGNEEARLMTPVTFSEIMPEQPDALIRWMASRSVPLPESARVVTMNGTPRQFADVADATAFEAFTRPAP